MLFRFAIHPQGETEDLASLSIDDQTRITASIQFLWQPAKLAHIHNDFYRLPRLATISAAAQSDVDIFLQITSHAPPHIVDTQQCAFCGRSQRGDSIGVNSVILVSTKSNANAMSHRR